MHLQREIMEHDMPQQAQLDAPEQARQARLDTLEQARQARLDTPEQADTVTVETSFPETSDGHNRWSRRFLETHEADADTNEIIHYETDVYYEALRTELREVKRWCQSYQTASSQWAEWIHHEVDTNVSLVPSIVQRQDALAARQDMLQEWHTDGFDTLNRRTRTLQVTALTFVSILIIFVS